MEKTCGNCPNVNVSGRKGWQIVGCKSTGYVIPHHTVYDDDRVTFWRVPLECPRDDNEVLKSEEQAPETEWVTKNLSDF